MRPKTKKIVYKTGSLDFLGSLELLELLESLENLESLVNQSCVSSRRVPEYIPQPSANNISSMIP